MKNLLVSFIALVFVAGVHGQKKFERSTEIGLALGTAYYLGEINPHMHFGGTLNPGGGVLMRFSPNRRWTLKGGIYYAQLEAYDSDSKVQWQVDRNLHFRNNLFETTFQAELNFWSYQPGNENFPFSPYLFGGLSYYSQGALSNYNGDWYELQPLGTEGQGTSDGDSKYRNNGIAIPFGVGLKANVAGRLSLGLEWGMRKTYTDYIDDISGSYADPNILLQQNGALAEELSDQSTSSVSYNNTNALAQRGDPSRNDWYNMVNVMLLIRIDKRPTTCWK